MRSTLSRRVVFLGAALSAFVAVAQWAPEGTPTATFRATGPAGFKIEGSAKKLEIKDTGSSLTFEVALTDLDTGIGLRNRHMLEDLEAEKFPLLKFTVPLDQIKVSHDGKTAADAKGTMSLHGQTKEIPFKFTTACVASNCSVDGSASLNLKDYGIKIRSYMGITVKPDVAIAAKFQLKK